MKAFAFSGVLFFSVALLTGCPFNQTDKSKNAGLETDETKLLTRGKTVYLANCTSCHNINPKLPGSQGPDVYGSSKELLTARLLYAKYPDNYTPKRTSRLMPAMPHLSNDIEALVSFLNSHRDL
jgi:mono/diheme cytochrome c family protein